MGVPTKDATIPENSPKELLLDKHIAFIAGYGKDKSTKYDYEMSEFLRLNGVYWGITALDIMNASEQMNSDEVGILVLDCS